MLILKLAAVAFVTCVLYLTLKKEQPAAAFLLAAGGCVCLFGVLASRLTPLLEWVGKLSTLAGGDGAGCLLQVLGIALAAQFAADACRDAGITAAAGAIELCGRLLALMQAMPLFQTLVDAFFSLLQ